MDGLRVTVGQEALRGTEGMRERKLETSVVGNTAPGESFADNLKTAIDSVDKLQKDADTKMQALATGRSQNIHETMIASEKADLALRLMVQVRNKVIDAYQEIMKMQV